MIYGIKMFYSPAFNGVCDMWIGLDGWREPLPHGVKGSFATEDINKAHAWREEFGKSRVGSQYRVEEFKIIG